MDTLDYIVTKFALDLDSALPIPIHGIDHGIERTELCVVFNELGFKTGAEIGVERGIFSKMICSRNPQIKLYAVDPWKAYKGYREHGTRSSVEERYEDAISRLAPYNCEIVRKFSMEAVKDFKDESLDFVYIDGNHDFQNVTNDIVEWSKKVRKGGIVSGHDYNKKAKNAPFDDNVCDVYEVLNAYTQARRIKPWFYLPDEGSSSWFFVKQ